MSIVLVVFFFIAVIVLGPLVIIFGFLYSKGRTVSKRELQLLRGEMAQIRAELADIKEQIADFIIRTN